MDNLYILEHAANPNGRVIIVDPDGKTHEFYFNERGDICMLTPERISFPVIEAAKKQPQYWLVTFQYAGPHSDYVCSVVIDRHPVEELIERIGYAEKDREAGRSHTGNPDIIHSMPLTEEQYEALIELPEFQ